MTTKIKCLDLFCGAGGSGVGYHLAGFEVVGVDLKPQIHYPFEFHQADALEYLKEHGHEFDFIHASPPCQLFSAMRKGRWKDRQHPNLIMPVRQVLMSTRKPYVVENVEGARKELRNPVMLCGTMFGLQTKNGSQLRRHRYFEMPWYFGLNELFCHHTKNASVIGVYGGGQHPQRRRIPVTIGVSVHAGGSSKRDYLDFSCFTTNDRRDAMGIKWMTGNELSQAIPPAYTKWIGEQFLKGTHDN